MRISRRCALLFSVLVLLAAFAAPATAEPVIPPGFQPASTSWTGPDTGYVLGYSPCAKAWCPTLLGTTDAGRHWRRLGAPPVALPDNHNHVALRFFGDRVAYVSDGVRVRTTRDGGATWQPIVLAGAQEPYYLSKIAETGGRVYAVLTTYGEGRGTTRLYSATAGSPVLAAAPGFAVTGGLTYGDLAVGGGLQVALGADYGTEQYWTSRDGARFTPAEPPCPDGEVASLAAVRERQVVALCSGSPGSPQPGSTERRLRHAPQLGARFSEDGTAPFAGINQGFAAASPTSATVAAVGGGVGFLHHTADAGHTWTTTELPERGFALTDLDFPGRRTGVVVDGQPGADGGSAVYRSTDGGKSWLELRFG
ncbi:MULTISPECIES: WD40/YVTN/BNR-like repeat-containing protein [Amycolatopsis]|uniref:Photosynthesis system II assembly factor Ycf48/Hcf136-like domain-containing protein n=1 Tax=Amycolatopsis bullii TaxID=941987 RepID=A0ABQ3K464_9PSEU|nr:hypothetical protein [Amycolatopsis bullii]GHG01467.1 hypothetical protein GCM10017567_15900 [Amycolatopsis bullii]